jgi:hypothetical protein
LIHRSRAHLFVTMKLLEEAHEFEGARGAFHMTPCAPSGSTPLACHPRFAQPTLASAPDTFRFLFEHFKKGIYIQIAAGRLARFVPFDNKRYVNNWHSRVDFGSFAFDEKTQRAEHWYANNYLVRYEKPFNQGNNGLEELKDMFRTLCERYPVPDVEFFINKRDFPLLTEDSTEPYAALFGRGAHCAQPAHPSLLCSMVSAPNFCDVAIPTPEDWTRASGRIFSRTKRAQSSVFRDDFPRDWRAKRPCAVFRGSNTGARFGEARVFLCELAATDARVDAKLTSVSTRLQFIDGVLCAPNFEEVDNMTALMGSFLSLNEQAQYRYIIHMPGHVQSYRLGAELATNSTLICLASETKLWFQRELIPWVHYVPLDDVSDLSKCLDWCFSHERECEEIARAARVFYETRLGARGCLDHLYRVLSTYREQMCPSGYGARRYSFQYARDRNDDGRLLLPAPAPLRVVGKFRSYLRIRAAAESEKIAPSPREFAIRAHCINPLVEEIPNFLYTFSPARGERVKGTTLSEYIQSQHFRAPTFRNILKQLTLSLAHARTRCDFTHGAATPGNILLYGAGARTYDYIVETSEGFQVWRAETELYIPIWTNYAAASAAGYRTDVARESDVKTLLDVCAREIERYHPRLGDCLRDLPHDPLDLFHAIDDKRFKVVDGVQRTHFGRTLNKLSMPSNVLSIVKRYYLQRFCQWTENEETADESIGDDITRGWRFMLRCYEGKRMRAKYHVPLNMVISLLTDGTAFALSPDEKKRLYEKARDALAIRHEF